MRLRKDEKAELIWRKIRIDAETEKAAYFIVPGTEEHHVRYNKVKKDWNCDCRFFSVLMKPCSHILAARKYMEENKNGI